MRIEKIEINGFKSFSDKTVFNFHSGVTAVVGPNGCGKSNLVDAFKWVMGEQSVKSLRGLKMEDVIFAGSSTQKPKSMAEVMLRFSGVDSDKHADNGADGKNLHELSLGRRLFRSGDSDYLINKKSCRLKDVRDVLIDTGLGMKAYSIFEQGRVDEILNSKPQDRRFLIEEIAGIMKYKMRKAETLKKISDSRTNLQRLKDIISEVERQLRSVQKHAQKAEKYKKLVTELKDIEIRVAAYDFRKNQENLDTITHEIGKLMTREGALLQEKTQADSLLQESKLAFVDKEKEFLSCQEHLRKEEKASTEAEGAIKLIKSQIENYKERTIRLKKEKEDLEDNSERLNLKIERKQKELAEKKSLAQSFSTIIEEHSVIAARIEDEIREDEDSLRDDRRQIISLAEKTSNLKNSTVHLTSTIEDLTHKEEKIAKELEETEKKAQELNTSHENAQKRISGLENDITQQIDRTENLKKTLAMRHEQLTSEENLLLSKREVFASLRSRLESLQEMESDMDTEHVNVSVPVLCQVADIVETDQVYERAIEAALGQKLSLSVVNNHSNIKEALEIVKKEGLKRSGFACLNSTQSSSLSVPECPEAIIKASEAVRVKQEYEELIFRLLQDVFIVQDIDTAFTIWTENDHSPCLVTLDGEVFKSQGLAYGGQERGILALKRQIRELKVEIDNVKAQIGELEGTIASVRNEISIMKNAISLEEKKIITLEKEKDRAIMTAESLQKDKTRLERRLHFLKAEAKDYTGTIERNKKLLEETEQALINAEQEKNSLNEQGKDLQAAIDEKRLMIESLKGELTDKKVQLATVQEKSRSLNSDIKGAEKGKSINAHKLKQVEEQFSKTAKDIEEKHNTLTQTEQFLARSMGRVSALSDEHGKLRKDLDAIRNDIEIKEKTIQKLNPELDKVRKFLSHHELQKTELTMKLSYIKENMISTYAINIEIWPSTEIEKSDREQVNILKKAINSLGAVNLSSLDEFEELKERFDFLTAQQNDLIQSIEGLENIIKKINATSRTLLESAFTSLNEKFKDVFTRLFGSGRAELILLEGDILEAGIEIIAQPPGKKSQSLLSLSGGEKALTAIALLFAGFMIKPTPLCLLDEVDAPLDESNTDRFTTLIKELAVDIQFIIVTHNKRVMEAADYIYGITMQEAGVSRTVSLKLEENRN